MKKFLFLIAMLGVCSQGIEAKSAAAIEAKYSEMGGDPGPQ